MNFRYKIFLLAAVLLTVISLAARAQKIDSIEVVSSGGNALVFLSGSPEANVTYTISRSVADSSSGFKPIGTLTRAGSIREFRQMAGDSLVNSFKKYKKIGSDAELWRFIAANPDLKNYGFAVLRPRFLNAMGSLFTDTTISSLPSGKRIYYKLSAPGKADIVSGYNVGEYAITQKPLKYKTRSNDSVVFISWYYPVDRMKSALPVYAAVYANTPSGTFIELNGKISAAVAGDSVLFNFSRRVPANRSNSFYIQPYDIFENKAGQPSDTVTLLSVDLTNIPPLKKVNAKDTTGGILITWQKLPANLFLAGIQIERSETPAGGYKIIATTPVTDSAFMDRNLKQGSPYYYRLLVRGRLNDKISLGKYSGFASAGYSDTHDKPDAPYQLSSVPNAKGVQLSWQAVNSNALTGYYVYRSPVADTTKMEVISRQIKTTTFTDATTTASRRINYSYAVKAINVAGVKSSFSNVLQAKLPIGRDKELTPAYINATSKGNGVFIEWQDLNATDNYLKGYILYKRKIQPGEKLAYDVNKKGSAEAARLGFTRVDTALIKHPYYQDGIANNGDQYEYAVSAVDMLGGEGGLSALAVNTITAAPLVAPLKLILKNIDNRVELTWLQANVAGLTGFNIYRRESGQKQFVKLANVDVKETSYADKTAQPQKLYFYQVKSANKSSESTGYAANSLLVY